jgi:hypothetical protein
MRDTKSRDELVSIGALIDVTDYAKRVGIALPTFMTTALWNDPRLKGNEENLLDFLDQCATGPMRRGERECREYNTGVLWQDPGMPCPTVVVYRAVIQPSTEHVAVVTFMEHEERFDSRIPSEFGGSFYPV